MEYREAQSVAELGRGVAQLILDLVVKKPQCVIGWPSGRTTVPILEALAVLPELDLSQATVVMMDDYAWPVEGGFINCDPNAHYSCHHWVKANWDRLVRAKRPNFLVPLADSPDDYERQIAELGGIDLFLAGLGASDGHVAFNPPGTASGSRTRVVKLAETTRQDNLHTFPQFRGVNEVPTHGVTVGLGTILEARMVIGLAHGADKADVVRRTLQAGEFRSELPSTFLYLKNDCRLLAAELGEEIS